MQNEKQCPNCRSFHTKSETQKGRLTGLVISGIAFIFFVGSLIEEFFGGYVLLAAASLIFCCWYAFKYFYIKVQFGYCKACNYKWSYD